jgi:hypothetical protein
MRKFRAMASVLAALITSGCAGMSETEQRTLTGATGGAGVGAILGAIGGNAALGAAAGALAGTAGGYLYDQHKKTEEAAYRQGQQDAKR